jgi:type III pantothenate kinase
MTSLSSYYCLDFGNTEIKTGTWENGKLIRTQRFTSKESLIENLNSKLPIATSSVLKPEIIAFIKKNYNQVYVIDSKSNLPFDCNYLSPNTLGIDRICNAAFMASLVQKGPKLCVDMGTCIKFDFLNHKNEYLGGSISPGLNMRFTAINHFTANLPMVEINKEINLIGRNTFECIQSGVQIGMKQEILGMINYYEMLYPDLTIFMTGGDLQNFDFPQKNNIFADDNLTLKGISEIYKLNATFN